MRQDVDRKPRPEPDPLMSVDEYGATNRQINRTLLAGFIQYSKGAKLPPRLSAKEWTRALTTWQSAPVNT